MKTLKFYSALFLLTFFVSLGSTFANSLTEEEKAGLQLMREEEKLAHDVYTVLYEKWQLMPFSNITRSETRHFEAIGFLLETYKLEDPAYEEPGKFRNMELAALYDSLVAKGSESLVAALEVGAFIEEVDIKDLQELLEAKPEGQIATVYENLLWGSENHIRAFTHNLSFRDQEYTPKVLSEATYAEIVGANQQHGQNGKRMGQRACGVCNQGGAKCRNR
ncbi:DUF2202 domain-containing protein [Draconibacterium sediminis]|uniref:DUF2202 domain-containing protein n=1 Tax=Draconibacterium sediminis TaxID=1544798 RepID=UPI0005D33C1B|nr:DUF2202 domain-containing protein [Draconibacterium sediminis]